MFLTGLNLVPSIFGLRQRQMTLYVYTFQTSVTLACHKGNYQNDMVNLFRKYLLNVANTISPNSVVEAVNKIRMEREM
jgi:hypothetical protein